MMLSAKNLEQWHVAGGRRALIGAIIRVRFFA